MDASRGNTVGKASGWRRGSPAGNDGLLVYFDGRLKFIEDECVIAVTESQRVADQGPDKVYTILTVEREEDTSAVSDRFFEALDVTGLFELYVNNYYVGLPGHLKVSGAARETLGRKIHVVISSRSGTGLAENFFEKTIRPLLARLEVRVLSRPVHIPFRLRRFLYYRLTLQLNTCPRTAIFTANSLIAERCLRGPQNNVGKDYHRAGRDHFLVQS